MSIALRVLSATLRRIEKPRLARMKTHHAMRRGLERGGRLLYRAKEDVRVAPLLGAPTAGLRFSATAARAPRTMIYFHGGGYIAGSPSSHRPLLAEFARHFDGVILAPDYRLAPEHPFPAAVEDALAIYDWALANGAQARSIALAGDSAGGGLVFASLGEILRTGRDKPGALCAFSPFADLSLTGASFSRLATAEALLPTSRIAEVVTEFLAGADPRDPRASPIFAPWSQLPSPPPTLIQVGSHEALRDDAARLAEGLRLGGGDVRLEIFRHAPHVFQYFAPLLKDARRALAAAGAFLTAETSASASPFDEAARSTAL